MKNRNSALRLKRKPWLLFTMLVSCCIFSTNTTFVFADTNNLNLTVSTNISAKCVFKTPTSSNITFGTYSPITENENSASHSSGNFDAKCTKNTASQIAMGAGQYSSFATSTSRAMSDGAGNYLSYEIYSDAGRSTIWNTTSTVSYTDQGGSSTNLPIYASIPAGQDVPAGEYSDTVTMTISY